MKEMIKICGKNYNCNFDETHTRKLIDILVQEFNKETCNDIDLMELIAGISFAILGDFDAILDKDTSLEQDIQKTLNNIDKLNNYLYGGYRSEV
jgi:hypothetical protein